MKTEKLSFTGSQGNSLVGYLNTPDSGETSSFALFAHCFTCTKNYKAIRNIAAAMVDEGFAVFRFDFTGLGESEGDFADTNFSSNVEDLIAAADFLKTNYAAPSLLIGHSLGGAAVLQGAKSIDSCKAVVTIASPHEPKHVSHLLSQSAEEIEREGEAKVSIAGRPFKIRKQFLDDLEEHRMDETIRTLNRALVIFHSPFDDIVSIDNAAKIFKAARHPKSFVSLDDADHLLSDERDSRYVGSVIAAWALRYLG